MLPSFNDDGCLPPGVHGASLHEIDERFGIESELRRAEMESLRWLVDLAMKAGVQRIVIDGSFVTDVYEPNDIDCALLIGDDYPKDSIADAELQNRLPFVQASLLTDLAFRHYVTDRYATDRRGIPKGVVEVLK